MSDNIVNVKYKNILFIFNEQLNISSIVYFDVLIYLYIWIRRRLTQIYRDANFSSNRRLENYKPDNNGSNVKVMNTRSRHKTGIPLVVMNPISPEHVGRQNNHYIFLASGANVVNALYRFDFILGYGIFRAIDLV